MGSCFRRVMGAQPLLRVHRVRGSRATAGRAEMKSPAKAGPSDLQRVAGSSLGLIQWQLLADDAHGAALLRALGRELDLAVDQREQGVVAAEADAHARMELGAALADDDVSGFDRLAAVHLHAE